MSPVALLSVFPIVSDVFVALLLRIRVEVFFKVLGLVGQA